MQLVEVEGIRRKTKELFVLCVWCFVSLFIVLRIELSVSCMLGKHCINKLSKMRKKIENYEFEFPVSVQIFCR